MFLVLMIQRQSKVLSAVSQRRLISGVAPVLYYPSIPHDTENEQIAKNTKLAINLLMKQKGPMPEPYTRQYTSDINAIKGEIEELFGSLGDQKHSHHTSKMASTEDEMDHVPLDKLALMERCVRHSLWSYLKEGGSADFGEMAKWIVYTAQDKVKLTQLKRQHELAQTYRQFRGAKGAKEPVIQLVASSLDQAYASTVDREAVIERRVRYDALGYTTTECNEAEVDAVRQRYLAPVQGQRLDRMVEMLEKFKPVLAREAITQRLAVKHLEGRLNVFRYLDWNPEIRDRCELDADNSVEDIQLFREEDRMSRIRLRTLAEVKDIMTKKQSEVLATQATTSALSSQSETKSKREAMLREIIALQGKRTEEKK